MIDYVSLHFKREEFKCGCGCGLDTIDALTLEIAEFVRNINGDKPITPSSGHRCREYNAKVGGAARSQHLVGRAVDLPVDDPKAVYDILCDTYPNAFGFGVYNTFVHIDTRTDGPARWDNRTNK